MKIAILSDTMGATSSRVPGHGLGRANWHIANQLLKNGHEVTLFGAPGSEFGGRMYLAAGLGVKYEPELAQVAYRNREEFDVFFDGTHKHILSGLFTELPVVNFYHDKWQPYQRNPILCTKAQRDLMDDERFKDAPFVHHSLDAKDFTPSWRPDRPAYALFIGFVYRWKQPILAIEAASRARMPLVVAGQMQEGLDELGSGNESSTWLGAVSPAERNELLRAATVYLQLGDQESFGLTTIEAGLNGCPVVAWPSGGSLDLIKEGVNGTFVDISKVDKVDAVVEAIARARTLSRKTCYEFTAEHFGKPCIQISQLEMYLERAAGGETW